MSKLWLATGWMVSAIACSSPPSDSGQDATAQATMTVSPPGPISLYVGQTQALTAVTNPPGLGIVWTSSAPTIVSVDQQGTATALMSGTADVTATVVGGQPSRSVSFTSTWIGPQNPGFEELAGCQVPGTVPTNCACAAQWGQYFCSPTGTCYPCFVCPIDGLNTGMPTEGTYFVRCPGGGGITQDVDFGPATTLTFDWTSEGYAQDYPQTAVLEMTGNGPTTTLWTQALTANTTAPQTATVQLPANLPPGHLNLRVGGQNTTLFFFVDNMHVQ